MEFTGERMIPGKVDSELLFEHVARYQFALKYSVDKVVLDTACGVGYGSYILSLKAKSVTGVDISKDAINFATENYPGNNVEFVVGDVLNLPFESEQFDLAVAYEILEHLDNPTGLLLELNRVLKKDGVIIISTPNRAFMKSTIDNPFHTKEYEAEEFLQIINESFSGHIEFFSQIVKSPASAFKEAFIRIKRKANIGPILPKKIKEISDPPDLIKLKTPYEFKSELNKNAEFFIAVIKVKVN